MKHLTALFALLMIAGIMTVSAQSSSYTVRTTSKCTNLSAVFTVPDGKTAQFVSLDVVPTFRGCTSTTLELSSIFVTVSKKGASTSRSNVLYKKTLQKDGLVTESVAVTSVKLSAGEYVLEVSPSSGTEATLTVNLLNN